MNEEDQKKISNKGRNPIIHVYKQRPSALSTALKVLSF